MADMLRGGATARHCASGAAEARNGTRFHGNQPARADNREASCRDDRYCIRALRRLRLDLRPRYSGVHAEQHERAVTIQDGRRSRRSPGSPRCSSRTRLCTLQQQLVVRLLHQPDRRFRFGPLTSLRSKSMRMNWARRHRRAGPHALFARHASRASMLAHSSVREPSKSAA